jgi:ankyrin repeat protein
MDAAYYGNEDIVKLLIERGADVNRISEGGETALHYAARAQKHSMAVIEMLLGRGAKVNVQDKEGRTPLMDGLGNRETMLALLAKQPDVTLRDKYGATVIYYAACQNLEWLIKPLIDRGANVNAATNDGVTPLMCATGEADSVDKPQMAQALIDNGADVNMATLEGETALMFAVQKGLAGCVRVLLREHARVSVKNKKGQTAVDIAKEGKQQGMLKLLSGG